MESHRTTEAEHEPTKLAALLGVDRIKRKGGAPKGPRGAESATRREQRRRREKELPSPVMSVEETALYLRVSEQTIYDDAHAGLLPHIRKGKRILIVRPLLDELIFNEARQRWTARHGALSKQPCPNCGLAPPTS